MCAEIFPAPGRNCPYGAAVCEPSTGTSFGAALSLTFAKTSNRIEATYANGSPCGDDGKTWSAKFYLYCNENSQDRTPRFLNAKKSTCIAEFEWSTQFACAIPEIIK